MRLLVTGAEGFVGTHLVHELESNGHEVIGSDKSDAPLDEEGQAAKLVRDSSPDYVVHLAARYGRLLCRDEPHLAVQDNAAATTELAAVCALEGIPVLYASSSEVYGDHGQDTITEDSELRTPTTIYGLSKRWGEEALSLYLPPEQLCIVRMNMLYGPEQLGGYGRCSLATFIKNAVAGVPFTVHTGATRSWLYISDAVRALRLLIEGNHTGVFNLSNDTERYTMLEVGEMVREETGLREMELVSPPTGQIKHKNYDSSKLRATINWEPEVDLTDGIARTIEWAKGIHAGHAEVQAA